MGVGCVIVRGVEDGNEVRKQGKVLASGVNCCLTEFKRMGHGKTGKFGRLGPDCHAEANAVAESAMLGTPLLGASCYVTMPPCLTCYTLLAASGIREIIMPLPMKPKQQASAADL